MSIVQASSLTSHELQSLGTNVVSAIARDRSRGRTRSDAGARRRRRRASSRRRRVAMA